MDDRKYSEKYWREVYDSANPGNKLHSLITQTEAIAKDFTANITPAFDKVFSQSKRMLEVACGPGDISNSLQEKYDIDVLGTDFAPTIIKEAQKRFPHGTYSVLDIFETEQIVALGKWDIILAANVIEHYREPYKILETLQRFCDYVIIIVPLNEPNISNKHQGESHCTIFDETSFSKYNVVDNFTFTSTGWTKGYQWANLIGRNIDDNQK